MSLCRVWSHRWLVYFHSESAWGFLGFFVVRVCECGEHFSLDQQYISTAVRLEDVILILTCLYF